MYKLTIFTISLHFKRLLSVAPSQIPAWSLNKVSDGHTNMRDDLLELRESGHHFDPIKPLPPAQDNVILATSKVI